MEPVLKDVCANTWPAKNKTARARTVKRFLFINSSSVVNDDGLLTLLWVSRFRRSERILPLMFRTFTCGLPKPELVPLVPVQNDCQPDPVRSALKLLQANDLYGHVRFRERVEKRGI